MKTASDLKKEINDLIFQAHNPIGLSLKEAAKQEKKIKQRIKYLKPLVNYLELKPSEEFYKKELDKTSESISNIMSRFVAPVGCSRIVISARRKQFEADYDVKKLRQYIKNLEFILA